jgi:hypothetical protein
MKISRPPLGRAYAGGRSEFATQWRPAATRSGALGRRRRRSPALRHERRVTSAPPVENLILSLGMHPSQTL